MLLGREAEQDRIAHLMSAARVGRSGALVLAGEAGIGKSSLLEDAVASAGTMRVLRAAGTRSEQDVSFAGVHQLLLPVLDLLPALPPARGQALAVALGLREGRTDDRFAVGAAVLSLLARVAEDATLLVVVDDVHLWDTASSAALAFAARRWLADRIALLAASRAETGSPLLESGLPLVRLGGLDREAVTALLREHRGSRAADTLATRVHAATAGNPLAVVELADEVDALLRASPEVPAPATTAVSRSFGRRVAELPERTRRLLLLAVVADGDLAVVTRAAAGLEVSLDDLAPAEDDGLVRAAPGRLVFRHALTRAGVYAGSEPALLRAVHRAVAEALPAADRERRTWHLCEATVGVDDDLATELDGLAARAGDRSAHAVAATASERAALLSSADDDRARRFLAAAGWSWLAGQAARAESLLQRADALVGDTELRGRVQGLRGEIALRAGSLATAREQLELAAVQVLGHDPDGAVALLSDAVMACFYLADAAAGLRLADRLDQLAVRCRTDEARCRAEIATGVALVLAGRGGSDRLRAAVDGLLAMPALDDDQHRPSWMILGPLFLRESGTGRTLVQHALEHTRARCALVTLPNLLFHTARVDATTDRWEQAAAAYEESVALARETGQTTDLTMSLAGLAWLRARTGDDRGCRDAADEAGALAERHAVHLARLWVWFALGDLALAHGRLDEACARYAAHDRMVRELGLLDVDLHPGPELAEVLHQLGRRDEARAVAAEHLERASAKGQPWAAARAERALGIVSASTEAQVAHFERALELQRASPDAFEEARTQLAYGAALRRCRRRVAARPHLRAAVATYERLGAHPWADRAAHELMATGETALRQDARGREHLTPQERQVARMLAEGRTTREAAAALFLSPKTVEYHLRHVYTKLDIGSRRELREVLGGG